MIPDSGVDNVGVSFYHKAVKLATYFLDHKKIKVLDLSVLESGKDVNALGKNKAMRLYENTDYLTMSEALKILI